MNLHDIPKEDTRPKIPEPWIRAAANFQRVYNNRHPIVFTIKNGEAVKFGYRNGNFEKRLQADAFMFNGLVEDWAERDLSAELDWDLVEFIFDEDLT